MSDTVAMPATPTSAAALQSAALRFLRRFGLVAAAWSALLAATAGEVASPTVLWSGVAALTAWALVSQVVRRATPWFVGWVLAAVVIELVGPLAGTPGRSVAGGVSFIVLAAAAISGRRWLLPTAVGVLSVVAVLRGVLRPGWSVTGSVGTVALFVFGGAALWWLVEAVLRAQQERDQLEARAMAAERATAVERERGEAAARLHDSVLQTLTAIGRAQDDDEARRLARRAGSELRDFLRRAERGPEGSLVDTLRSAVTAAADGTGVGVSAAGDAPLDTAGEALVDATAEAVRNAVAHGRPPVRVLVECADGTATAWIADRGPGFELDGVPHDRLGVRGSIVGRVEAVGGRARLAVDDGCEWELSVPVAG